MRQPLDTPRSGTATSVTGSCRQAALPALLTLALAATASATESPWSAFDELRAALAADAPLTARFVQTFVPAGFDEEDGETETGLLSIALPECIRWDYGEPFPKSFLLCQDTVYYWNPGEPRGHRYPVANEEAPGLDFFLLTTADLQLRYNATAESTGGGLLVILEPIRPTDDVVRLEVRLTGDHRRVTRLAYEDAEGNRTTFALDEYGIGVPEGTFTPPVGMEWEDP